nr:unnamed protein product [Digitaria exilis]
MTWTSATRPPAGTMVAATHRAARRLPRPSPRTATATCGPPPADEAGEDEPSIPAAAGSTRSITTAAAVEQMAGSTRLPLFRRRERRGSNGRAGSFRSTGQSAGV